MARGAVETPSWERPERMTQTELVTEVFRLRELERERAVRTRDLERAQARIAAMEVRDADRAKELAKVQAELRVACRKADLELQLRLQAEKEKNQFHALLIQERVRKVPS